MVVVSNTSPLTNLSAIGQFGLLLVLVDEKEGRHMASRLGLRPLGTLGMLLQAKQRGQIEEVRPLLDALRLQAGFYLREDLFLEVLSMAGEKT